MTQQASRNAGQGSPQLTCLACGYPTSPYYTARNGHAYERCGSCGSLRLAQAAASTVELYEDLSYGPELFDRAWATLIDRRRMVPLTAILVEHLPQGATVLDVGAGGGHFVRRARLEGFEAKGIEMSARLASAARETYDVPVEVGSLEESDCANLDAITLWDVVEHVWDPQTLLEQVRSRLDPSGLLFLSTPVVDSSVARAGKVLFGRLGRWPHVLPPAHVAQFSRAGVRHLLSVAGFDVLREVNFETPLAAAGGVDAATWQGRLRAAARDPRRAIATAALAPAFYYGRWRGRGDTVIVVARPAVATVNS